MAKNASTVFAQTKVVKQKLTQHPELQKYGDNALPLLGLALYVHADDMDELATEAMTDGTNDKKIDFCHIDRTTQYAVVAQGYTCKEWGKKSAPANKASDLIAAVGWLFSGDMDQVPEKLRTVAVELRRAIKDGDINRVDLLYIHNCQEGTNVGNELRTAAKTAAAVIQDKSIAVGYREVGIGELESLCLASESEILVQDAFTIPADNVIEETGTGWRSIVATMPGDWLHELHARHGNRLFSANYRDFLGVRASVKNINYGIKTTVQDAPDNFWTYNNGITALARIIGKKGKKFQIEGISIINGAQTTGSIGECSLKEAAKVKIVCRFVQCTDKDVLHNIIRYNNTQNAFRSSDQRSTDTIQRRLAGELLAHKINYVHRRSSTANPRNSISAESVAPLICAFHGDPQTAARRRNDIFDLDIQYNRVFPKVCSGEHVLLVHCLGLAVDEVKYGLKIKDSAGKATRLEVKNYEVLKYSMAKLFFVRIMGSVAEEILQVKVADLYTWRYRPETIKPDLEKLVFPWKEAVEAVLPIVASIVGDNAYETSRDFKGLPALELKVAAAINGLGELMAQRFALLKDATIF